MYIPAKEDAEFVEHLAQRLDISAFKRLHMMAQRLTAPEVVNLIEKKQPMLGSLRNELLGAIRFLQYTTDSLN